MGRMAQEKSSNPKVKDFAAMMVKDHSAANEELNSSQPPPLPSSPGAHADASEPSSTRSRARASTSRTSPIRSRHTRARSHYSTSKSPRDATMTPRRSRARSCRPWRAISRLRTS
jgi:hypothetical protein